MGCFKFESMPKSIDQCALKMSPEAMMMDRCDVWNALGVSQAIPTNHSENASWE